MQIGWLILKWIGMGCLIVLAAIVLVILIGCLVAVIKSVTGKK